MDHAALLVVGIVIGFALSNPADARKLSGTDLCFSRSFPPDQRIATCSALIHTITRGAHTKASVLFSRAGAYGQKGDYRHAVEDTTRSIKLEPSAEAHYTRALAYHNIGQDEAAIQDSMPPSRSHPITRMRYSSVGPRIKERWIIAKQSRLYRCASDQSRSRGRLLCKRRCVLQCRRFPTRRG